MPGSAPTFHIREADTDERFASQPSAGTDLARLLRRRWVAERGTTRVASLVAELHDLVLDRSRVPSARVDLDGQAPEAWPTLVETARAALAEAGVGYLYRLAPPNPRIHQALGLGLIGRFLQRTKALRPLSLLAARLDHPPGLDRAGKVLDPFLGLPLRAPGWRPRQLVRGHSIVELSLVEDAPALVALLDRAARGGVGRGWTEGDLIAAYGPDATLIGETHSGVIVAFVVVRIEPREGLDVARILDIVARDDELDLHAGLLRAAERRVRGRADAMTLLDGGSAALGKAARRAGFVDSRQRWVLAADRLDPERPPLPPGVRWRLGLIDAVDPIPHPSR